jgi:hypothetical protein
MEAPCEIGLYAILRLGFNELVYKIEGESRDRDEEFQP